MRAVSTTGSSSPNLTRLVWMILTATQLRPARYTDQLTEVAADYGAEPLDLRELEFVDSSGLRTLLIAHRQAVAAREDFALVAGHRGLERTLEIAGVRGIFEWTSANELT